MARRPVSRDEKMVHWKSQGLPEAQLEFLQQNPEMVDLDEATRIAAGPIQR
jgi:hypothetical protein